MNKLHQLLLSNTDIKKENISFLINCMDSNRQRRAMEILCGVNETPVLNNFEGKFITNSYRDDKILITDYVWNPLNEEVEYSYRSYQTIVVKHNLDDESLSLLKENLMSCNSREEADKLNVFSGGSRITLPYNVLSQEYHTDCNLNHWQSFVVVDEKLYSMSA